jgi:hypothetical protein
MGVPTAHSIASMSGGILGRLCLDLLCAAKEDLTVPFGEFCEVMRLVDLLKKIVNAIRYPCDDRKPRDEFIESMTVQKENSRITTLDHNFIGTSYSQQMGYDLSRSIVIAVDPGDLNLVREFAECGKNSPVLFLESAKIDRIEDIPVENQSLRRHVPTTNRVQKMHKVFCLAILTPEVDVRYYDSIVHGVVSSKWIIVIVVK